MNFFSTRSSSSSISSSSAECTVSYSSSSCGSYCGDSQNQSEFKAYKKRWYVLILYSILGVAQNTIYSTVNTIAPTAEKALHLNQTDIGLPANWFSIMFLVGVFPYMWLVKKKGLRMPVVSGAVFMAMGAAIRCLNTSGLSPTYDRVTLHLGQAVNGLASAIFWFACTKISAVWFPLHERVISTTIGLLSGTCGIAVSFLVSPYSVKYIALRISDGFEPVDEDYAVAIQILFYGQALMAAILCLITLFHFPSEPPTPPSYTASTERFSFTEGLVKFFQSSDAVLIWLLSSVSSAVWSLFSSFKLISP